MRRRALGSGGNRGVPQSDGACPGTNTMRPRAPPMRSRSCADWASASSIVFHGPGDSSIVGQPHDVAELVDGSPGRRRQPGLDCRTLEAEGHLAAALPDEHDEAIRRDDVTGEGQRLVAADEVEDDVGRSAERGGAGVEKRDVRTELGRALQPGRGPLSDRDDQVATGSGEEAQILERELAEPADSRSRAPARRPSATAPLAGRLGTGSGRHRQAARPRRDPTSPAAPGAEGGGRACTRRSRHRPGSRGSGRSGSAARCRKNTRGMHRSPSRRTRGPRRHRHALGVRTQGVDPTSDLVAEDERELDARLAAVDDVEVGVAHAATGDADANLGAGRLGSRDLDDAQGSAGRVEAHGAHRSSSRNWRRRPRWPPGWVRRAPASLRRSACQPRPGRGRRGRSRHGRRRSPRAWRR